MTTATKCTGCGAESCGRFCGRCGKQAVSEHASKPLSIKRIFQVVALAFAGLAATGIIGVMLETPQHRAQREAAQAVEAKSKAEKEVADRKAEAAKRAAEAKAQQKRRANNAETEAFHQAKRVVTALLKSPATANFQSVFNADIRNLGDGKYRVNSFVDSQNGFGAILRTYFSARLQTTDGERFYITELIVNGKQVM
jgi:hypothetical protein